MGGSNNSSFKSVQNPNQQDITLSGASFRSNFILPSMRINPKQEAQTSPPSSTKGRVKKMKLVHLSQHTRWEYDEFLPDD